ncbi:DNA-directed RNA polymerases I, II, and III subunit RPABC3 [Coemansia furcata]|uniref:DNA-directed RNA polymerases I, II, and III subunit RPABC3 n=1 Tax=Coemansia furcata TaxID=417177 RepID=A0ACC1LKJ7_9FUNG|nr:DNA-directed RNA polymerases I, II, and III subunit RPABC3 [Coemansia furcata]
MASSSQSTAPLTAATPAAAAAATPQLADILRDHQGSQAEHKRASEQLRKDAVRDIGSLCDSATTSLSKQLARVLENQREIEALSRDCAHLVQNHTRSTLKWTKLVDQFSTALKELGDVSNWAHVIERDMLDVAATLELVHASLNPATTAGDKRDNILFSDTFDIKDLDKDGKKFDRVSRVDARSQTHDMSLILDINSELCRLDAGDKFKLTLASSLSLSDVKEPAAFGKGEANWRAYVNGEERSLADDYEYVMFGRVYRYDNASGSKVSAFVSFGGLLACLEGDIRHLQNFVVGDSVYLLLKVI